MLKRAPNCVWHPQRTVGSRVKLLIIHQAFVSPDAPGGTRHFELARHLVERGDEVTIVASNLNYLSGSDPGASRHFISHDEIQAVKVLRAFTPGVLHRSFPWRVLAFVSFMVTSFVAALQVRDVDVVLGTSPPLFQAVSAWLVTWVRRRPFVLEIRDLWPEFAIDMGVLKNRGLIRASRWLESFLYARADHIVVNSPAYRDYLIAHGVLDVAITLVANGTDPDAFDPAADGQDFRREHGAGASFIVTYAGALGLANDIPTLLRAAEHLMTRSDIGVVIVGDGKERGRLERDARERGLTNVRFAGSIPKIGMREVLAGSDACVAILQDIPMFRRTYPNKVFDYMAAGRPVILAIDGVIRHVVESEGAGVFVPPGDARKLADAVLYLADQRDVASRMGQAGRRAIDQRFNRQSQSREFGELVHRLAAES